MGDHTARRGRGRLWLLALAAILSCGVIWGITTAAGASSSPSPGAEKIVLRVGNTQDVDSLNPFIGYSVPAYEVYHLNYDMLTGYKPNGDVAPEIADSWTSTPDVLDVDVQDPPRHHVAGRRGAHRQGRRLHLQLHHRERPLGLLDLHGQHEEGRGRRRHDGQVHPDQAQGQHPAHVDPDRARAHLEQDLGQGRVQQLPEQPADHRLRAVPDRRVQEERLHAHGRQQGLLEGRAQDRRGHLRELHQPGHHDDGPQGGEHRRGVRRAGRAVQRAQERARHHRRGRRPEVPRRARLQRLREPGLPGQPGPPGHRVPPGRQLGGRQGEDRRHLHGRLRRRRPVDPGAEHRRRLDAHRRGDLRLRPREGQAAARRRRLQGRRRRRRPRGQAGQADQAAPLDARASRRSSSAPASSSPARSSPSASASSSR